MQHPITEHDLREALDAFETCLQTPIIPGEFSEWSCYLQKAWPTVVEQVQQQVHNSHRQQLVEIAQQDPEMLARVKQIQIEDHGIFEEMTELAGLIDRLVEQAPRLERMPAATQDSFAERVVQHGISFVTRVKTQEVGVRTWLSEAFNRERGVGD